MVGWQPGERLRLPIGGNFIQIFNQPFKEIWRYKVATCTGSPISNCSDFLGKKLCCPHAELLTTITAFVPEQCVPLRPEEWREYYICEQTKRQGSSVGNPFGKSVRVAPGISVTTYDCVLKVDGTGTQAAFIAYDDFDWGGPPPSPFACSDMDDNDDSWHAFYTVSSRLRALDQENPPPQPDAIPTYVSHKPDQNIIGPSGQLTWNLGYGAAYVSISSSVNAGVEMDQENGDKHAKWTYTMPSTLTASNGVRGGIGFPYSISEEQLCENGYREDDNVLPCIEPRGLLPDHDDEGAKQGTTREGVQFNAQADEIYVRLERETRLAGMMMTRAYSSYYGTCASGFGDLSICESLDREEDDAAKEIVLKYPAAGCPSLESYPNPCLWSDIHGLVCPTPTPTPHPLINVTIVPDPTNSTPVPFGTPWPYPTWLPGNTPHP